MATAIAALGCGAAAGPAQAGILGTFARTTQNGYTWPVPAGDTIAVSVFGASGGDYVAPDGTRVLGGLGALASGELAVTPGQQFSIVVAGRGDDGRTIYGDVDGCSIAASPGGFPGGGPTGVSSTTFYNGHCTVGGSGGGATRFSYYAGGALLVAGGGGGAGSTGAGGDAGADAGASGSNADSRCGDFPNATGGTQGSGGQPGRQGGCSCSLGATAGSPTSGGIGAADDYISGTGGAGGGEGWWAAAAAACTPAAAAARATPPTTSRTPTWPARCRAATAP